jgi:hypothetical protein
LTATLASLQRPGTDVPLNAERGINKQVRIRIALQSSRQSLITNALNRIGEIGSYEAWGHQFHDVVHGLIADLATELGIGRVVGK